MLSQIQEIIQLLYNASFLVLGSITIFLWGILTFFNAEQKYRNRGSGRKHTNMIPGTTKGTDVVWIQNIDVREDSTI